MTGKSQMLIQLIALAACLSLQMQALAQSSDTYTVPNSGPRVELVASTHPIFVDDISFEGLQAISASDVEVEFREQLVGLMKDALLVPFNVQKGVKVISQMLADIGYMNANVEVRIENLSTKLKRVVFVVDEGPPAVIRELRFEGNRVFTDDELLSQIDSVTFMSHDVYDRARLDYNLNRILDFIRSRGYLRARLLDPELKSVNGNLSITVPVEEGRRFRLGEITVLNSIRLSPEQIVETIGLKKGDIVDGGKLSVALDRELVSVYGNLGYPRFYSEVDRVYRITKGVDEGVLDVQIAINEGPSYRIGKVEFRGNEKVTTSELRRLLLFKEGDVYNQQLIYDSFKALRQSGLIQPIGLEANAHYQFDEGTGLVEIVISVNELRKN